jgi:DNA-binding transcriptional LysR family regulator
MHHLDVKLLRSFAAVAGERSVTRAAERLHLTQPTVSGQIKELEQTLGFLLFHRTSRKVALSEEGERLLPLVEELLLKAEEVRQAAAAMQVSASSKFTLGAAMYTMDLGDRIDLLDDFAASHPKLDFTIINRLQFDQVRQLLTDRLDAALLLGIAADLPEIRFTSDLSSGVIANEVQYPQTLERVVLGSRQVGLLVPDDVPLAAHKVIPRAALSGESVVMLGKEHGEALIDPLVGFLSAAGAILLTDPVEGNALAVQRYAKRNHTCAIGIGWFPTAEGMVWREVEGMNVTMDFALVLGPRANKAARQFFEFARTRQIARGQGGPGADAARPKPEVSAS